MWKNKIKNKIKIQTNNLKFNKLYGNILFGKNYYFKKEVCSKCHPYWTGNLRLDTKGGRADRFKKKYGIE